jgi:hypothetical protein
MTGQAGEPVTDEGTGQMADEDGTVEIDDEDGTQPVDDAAKPTPPAWTPPSREEWEKVTASLRETASESKRRKEKLRELEAATATAEEKAAKEIAEKATREAEGRWLPRVVASEARSALAGAGCKDVKRFARLVDTSTITFGDDGEPIGLDDQVAALKADYPEAFRKERATSGDETAAKPGSTRVPTQKRTATERQAAALLGRG